MKHGGATICPRSSDQFYIVCYYIKWVTTSWTHSIKLLRGVKWKINFDLFKAFIYIWKIIKIIVLFQRRPGSLQTSAWLNEKSSYEKNYGRKRINAHQKKIDRFSKIIRIQIQDLSYLGPGCKIRTDKDIRKDNLN